MNTILEQLYNGELRPDLRKPESDEMLDSQISFNQSVNALNEFMPELEPKISAILDAQGRISEAERKDMFQYGFSLGVRLVVEAMSGHI